MEIRPKQQLPSAENPNESLPVDNHDTVPSIEELSRRTTDFGLGNEETVVEQTDSLLGIDLGDFVIESLLASGGMGRVYKGRQRLPERDVAVKVHATKPSITTCIPAIPTRDGTLRTTFPSWNCANLYRWIYQAAW